MHAGGRAGHSVLAAGMPVVCGTGAGAGLARVSVVDVAAMGVAVVPIFELFVGSGMHIAGLTAAGCLMSSPTIVCAAVAAASVVKTPDVATIVATTSATIVIVFLACINGGRGLLLVLLLHSHAVLLHRAELALERRDCRPLRLNAFLRGSLSCAEVCDGFAVGGGGGVIFVDGGHPVAM